jgi:uncharacterized membrane protein
MGQLLPLDSKVKVSKNFVVSWAFNKNTNIMELANFLEKNQKFQYYIQMVTLKITSCRIICKKQIWKNTKVRYYMDKMSYFLAPLAIGQHYHMASSRGSSQKYKNF